MTKVSTNSSKILNLSSAICSSLKYWKQSNIAIFCYFFVNVAKAGDGVKRGLFPGPMAAGCNGSNLD